MLTGLLGFIRCRFIESSQTMMAFGELIAELGNPRFVLANAGYQELAVSADVISGMRNRGVFALPIHFGIPAYATHFDIRLAATKMAVPESVSASPLSVQTIYKEF